jgi:hypothetical protein
MGIFDKAKHFMGGHGAKVQHLIIEKQSPDSVTLPITDTVVKGRFQVTSDKDCEVLSMKSEFIAEYANPKAGSETAVLASDSFPNVNVSRSDDMLKYPYALKAGQTVEDTFLVHMEKDLPTFLQEKGWERHHVMFFLRTMVDVKGSPFDPEAKNVVKVVD